MSQFKELKKRIEANDNRGTAKPYLLLLQKRQTYVAHDDYDNGANTRFVEHYTGDYITCDTKEELINELKEAYEDDYSQEIENSIQEYKEGDYWETQNVFLTDKGYEEHKEQNGHNLGEHRTYGIHAFRNPEIRTLFEALDRAVELEQENAALKEKLAKALAEFPCGCTDEQCDYCFTKDEIAELGE